jgi:hypothetical protein
VGTIVIRKPGERADRLVRCLRANAREYRVAIEHHPDKVLVVDQGGHGADMPAFLRERLDACAREVGFGWGPHLAIAQTAG